nr:Hypothetical protein CBG12649 [Haemonchus contortus]
MARRSEVSKKQIHWSVLRRGVDRSGFGNRLQSSATKMRPPPTGHMVINMKTTITTHGAHNGVIVHAGVQSGGAGTSQGSQWYIPSQFPQIETPGGTTLHAVAAGTSQENLATSWPSLHINTASPIPEQRPPRQDRSPLLSRQEPSPQPRRREPSPLPRRNGPSPQFRRQEPSPPLRRAPSPPASPVFSFTGRDSPPDEFIQPTKVTLNVFNPGNPHPIAYDTSLRRANSQNTDALINDSVTTTTTIEVFRAPLDPSNPDRVVALPPPPVPSVDDRPLLLRVNGPGYEKWSSQRTETLINDRPVQAVPAHPGKAVQWKETLVEGLQGPKKVYDPYSGQRSPYANAVTSPQPPARHQFQLPTVNSFEERLLPRPTSNRTAYLVQSPTEFSTVSHPLISNSNEDLSRTQYQRSPIPADSVSYHEIITHPAVPDTTLDYRTQHSETPILNHSSHGGYEQVRRPALPSAPLITSTNGTMTRSVSSPLYVEPKRDRSVRPNVPPPPQPRRHSRRSHSSHRRRRDHDHERYERHRSESPSYRRPSAITPAYTAFQPSSISPGYRLDPNVLPGEGPSRANSREIFNLYQTRDAMQNVVAQFDELGYGYGDGPLLSPLTESDHSVISELSARADRTKSDALVSQTIPPFTEQMPRPLHRTSHAMSSDDFYEELDHIYEELDNYRAKLVDTPERSMSSSTLKGDQENEEPEFASVIQLEETVSESDDENDGDDEDDVVLPEELSEYKALIESQPLKGGVRKAHPDGLVFPRITTVVVKLPELPEEHESSSQSTEERGVTIVDIPYADGSVSSFKELSPSDLTCSEDESKAAVVRARAQVRADHCKLLIHGWETLISDSEDGF